MLRPLAIAIGLALCLLGPSSAYAGKISRVGCALESWYYKNREGWRYYNGKVILPNKIKCGRYERDEINLKPAWQFLWGGAAAGYVGSLWNNRQK